ncbi:Crp/Fnr family transcriptional regulator [Pedobacter yulinensis]|uniref:Crp/Fnr family transcriptional regulator n=1 Tax=Pedobacter yulinensis TaxID=2126353 RepID=A0A2T3HS04_9SPHI|nr:ThuA domain-containing protein [Pedobacter yulinensis]PST85181.1 Crp/Fnr family transcriptional regulator [Pedobacter yulinensis]
MKKITSLLLLFVMAGFFGAVLAQTNAPRILVFSKTEKFRHNSIPEGIAAIKKLGAENNFLVDATEDAAAFTPQNLKKYAVVVFLNTTGDVLDDAQQKAFEKYIKSKKGYVGVHAATDTEYGWPWYGKLAGAYFVNHPQVQTARFMVKDKKHPATSFLPDTVWTRKDELYNFKDINPNLKVLLTIDESSYQGGTNGPEHPMAWCHVYEGSRAFTTALGHTKESYSEPLFLKHLLGGIEYALGRRK